MKTIDYLDLAKTRAGLSSDYALANALGVTRQAVSSWRSSSRPRYPEVLHALLLAELCQIEAIRVLADIELDKADHYGKFAESAALNALMARTISTTFRDYVTKAGVVITGILIGTVLAAPSPVNASSIYPAKPTPVNAPSLYIMSTQ